MGRVVKLYRRTRWPQISKAVVKADGVHIVDHDGKVRPKAEYASIESMNTRLKELGFGQFEIVKAWPGTDH